jgi:probable HAF family extracellular repeat protein
MRHLGVMRFIAATVLALAIPLQLGAQDIQDHHPWHHHYQLVQIPTLGGVETNFFDTTNNIAVLNDRGGLSGGAAETLTPDPNAPQYWFDQQGDINYAFLWKDGFFTSLGSLPGTNNSYSLWISANGNIAGGSENGQIDPSVPELPEISAVMWRGGKITNLGNLPQGGYESAAVSVNSWGEAVGVATDLVPDSNSLLPLNQNLWPDVPYNYQLRAFIWDAKNGMQDLGTLGTGTDAEAWAINDRGQVIGDSYISSAPGVCPSGIATGAFIWDRTHGMVDLGNFGGTCTLPNNLNNRGQVVGLSTVAGDGYQRGFLWDNGRLRNLQGSIGGKNTGALAINEDGAAVGFAYLTGETTYHAALWRDVEHLTGLGTLGSDLCAFAQGINSQEQVVGDSLPTDCSGDGASRAFLWENGSIVDLNSLIPPNSPLYLIYAYTINERGEIAVNGLDANGVEQAALLIPCDENHLGLEGCDYSLVNAMVTAEAAPAPVAAPMPSVPPTRRRPSQLRGTLPRGLPHASPQAALSAGDAHASSITDGNRQADFLSDSQLSPIHGRGYCLVGKDELTGYCHAGTPWVCWSGRSSACPVGDKALKPEKGGCGLAGSVIIDADRACSF